MRVVGFLLLAGTAATPVLAQSRAPAPAAKPAPAPTSEPEEEVGADIVVQGQKPVGSVVGDIPPEQTLSPADIRSYGVSSVNDLLTELAPQTRSDRGSGGAPVVLLNGRRIANFSEIRDLPTEAILRVEILPEEVALKYGYRADQRVVNFVLRPRFRAKTVELDDRIPTEGGRNQPEGEFDWLRIQRTGRMTFHAEYTQAGALTEAERNIIQGPNNAAIGGNVASLNGTPLSAALGTTAGVGTTAANGTPTLGDFTAAPNTTNQGAYRTLLPATKSFQANGVYATSIFGTASATFNARVERDISDAQQGLASGTLLLQPGNPFSPFGQPVAVTQAFDALGPIAQHNASTTAHLGASFNGDQGRWRWSLTSSLDYTDSDTRTDGNIDLTGFQARLNAGDPTANPFAPFALTRFPDSIGRSHSTSASIDSLVTGPIAELPAGNINTSLRIGASLSDFASRSSRLGEEQSADISRDIGNAQLNVDVPIANRNKGVLAFLGDLSLNGNVAADHLSDFGTLWTLGYGANWQPIKGLRVIASVTDQDDAPSAQQLGNPAVTTPGVRVFDYVRGTTATVTTLTGGNPDLIADNQHTTKIGVDLRPWTAKDISFTANYVTAHTDNPIASFPAPTAAIEAAFPTRFTRDADDNLLRIDSRPINFARTERSELRYGVNLSFALKSKIQKELEAFRAGTGPNPFAGLRPPGGRRPDRDGTTPDGSGVRGARDAANGGPPPGGGDGPRGGFGGGGYGGGGGGRGFGRYGGGGGAAAGGRLQFALYHTWHFTDRVLIADNGPSLDLLNGDAIGSAGGQSRHELEGQAGYTNNGLGARASLNFQSATRVNGGTPAAPTTLDFGSLTTVNLRLFADLGQRLDLIRAHPWLRGTRIVFSVTNLFNQRQRVNDQAGTVPIGFQPGYLDPLGRTIRLSVRKLFF